MTLWRDPTPHTTTTCFSTLVLNSLPVRWNICWGNVGKIWAKLLVTVCLSAGPLSCELWPLSSYRSLTILTIKYPLAQSQPPPQSRISIKNLRTVVSGWLSTTFRPQFLRNYIIGSQRDQYGFLLGSPDLVESIDKYNTGDMLDLNPGKMTGWQARRRSLLSICL